MMSRLILNIHRVLGTILSLLFFMWFASGFVMLFHSFPSISTEESERGLRALSPLDSPMMSHSLDSLWGQLPQEGLISLKLQAEPYSERGYVLLARSKDSTYRLSSRPQASPSDEATRAYAERFSPARILRVDTIRDVDTWIPYRRSHEIFPVHRFVYDDAEQTELSVSRQTGEGVQLTTRESRLWAYLGAIPHWIYFSSLRQHRDLWVNTIIFVSALGFVMCLTGLYAGLRAFWLTRKSKQGLHSPYTKRDYRWHHLLGFVFGLSVTAFIFSGLMSVYEVPQSLLPTQGKIKEQLYSQTLSLQAHEYRHSAHRLIEDYQHEGIKTIEWRALGEEVVITLSTEAGKHYFTRQLSPLSLSEQDVQRFVASLGQVPYRIELLQEYDNYYIDRHHKRSLPVYRITLEDSDASSIYINPNTAELISFDKNTRLRRLLYQGLHSLVFAPLVKHPLLWGTLITLCLLGGLIVSLTGISLSLRYLGRRRRRRVAKRERIQS